MSAFKAWCQNHRFWLYLAAVIVPVGLSLGLQYRSLSSLEFFSAAAHHGTLSRYLRAVADDVASFYRTNAERSLQVSWEAGSTRRPAPMQPTFQQAEGVQLFFVAVMPSNLSPALSFYRPSGEVLTTSPPEKTVHAVQVALAPLHYLSTQQIALQQLTLSTNEQDPDHRMILKPLTDDVSQVAGVVGMILAPDFLQHQYLPNVIRELLPKFCREEAQKNAIIAAHDAGGRLLLSTDTLPDGDSEASMPLSFLFTDWQLGVWNRYVTPEQWSRLHFMINMGLSVLLTLLLITAVLLALRAAVRSMCLARMQTDFVSNVSHELRTPLASIRASGELLRLGRVKEGEQVREYGNYIETESLRLTRLINNILDFAKMESQQKTYCVTPVDIEGLVMETLRVLDARCEQEGFTIDVDRPPTPLPPAVVDADSIQQAVLNVLDNAMKYSGDARRIRIQLGQAAGYNTIAVTDYGIGIPRDEQERIFDRFYRVSTGLVHNVKGSGLGLAIVHHIVTANHGRITLESTSGEGTTLTIDLPVADVSEDHGLSEAVEAVAYEREGTT